MCLPGDGRWAMGEATEHWVRVRGERGRRGPWRATLRERHRRCAPSAVRRASNDRSDKGPGWYEMDEIEVDFPDPRVPYRRLSVRATANAAHGDREWAERLAAPLARPSAIAAGERRQRQWMAPPNERIAGGTHPAGESDAGRTLRRDPLGCVSPETLKRF
ncbi:hypothetical protein TARUN_9610 [Trichoderma arundinaceum]|uniref:Uncharacterized protein n=1 Tax=Trichoderma arundinaceum TaxID=490622 RepID=A0A395N951_TRIAR|nr:hypothetical protein TARUN_9610 [Trichoderma arundinaceum]